MESQKFWICLFCFKRVEKDKDVPGVLPKLGGAVSTSWEDRLPTWTSVPRGQPQGSEWTLLHGPLIQSPAQSKNPCCYLESRLAQNNRWLHPKLAHDGDKVAHNLRPLARGAEWNLKTTSLSRAKRPGHYIPPQCPPRPRFPALCFCVMTPHNLHLGQNSFMRGV